MSIRTKLLAAAIGVPVAVLVLGLWLVMLADQQVYTSAEAMLNLFHKGRGSNWREFGRSVVQALDDGVLADAWVFRWAREDTEESEDDYWTARGYFSEATGRLTRPDIDPRKQARLVERLNAAVLAAQTLESQLLWDGDDLTIIASDPTRGRRFAVVAQTRDRRGLIRQLYLVLVFGALAVAGIGWLVITRLVLRPVAALAGAADQLAAGAHPAPLPTRPGARDELARTAEAFNRMAREIRSHQEDLEDRVLKGLERIQRTEQHLLIAQRLAATGKLAAGLAHEINNPLGGMRNAVRALGRGDLPAERQTLYLGLLEDGLARIELIVKRFLSFTPRAPDARSIDLVDVVERSIALAEHRIEQADCELQVRLPERGTAVVFGDATELQQVVLNLLLNAADALGSHEGRRRVRVDVGRHEGEVLVRVTDTGPGIPQADQDRCFDMFFTTKGVGEGTGMGLAVAHTIVTNHGGSIKLVSRPGEGAAFTIYLPSGDTEALAEGGTPA
jgi:signal transduction histidine kinase